MVRVPVSVAGFAASTAALVTVIDWEWFVTSFPEESRMDSTGWVEKSSRFTIPAACRVRASCVASPKRRFIVEVLVMLFGEVIDAVRILSPIVPLRASPGKLTCPPLAAWVVVPIREVFAVPLIDNVVEFPMLDKTREPVVFDVLKP
jgi:hypothetical protein